MTDELKLPAPKRKPGRPKKSDTSRRGRDIQAIPPRLPDIAYQVDNDLEQTGENATRLKKASDWRKIQWMIFAEAYFECGSACEAYKLAGYKVSTEHSAQNGGSRTLNYPWVQAYLRRLEIATHGEEAPTLTEDDKALLIATPDEILILLSSMARDHNLSSSKRLEAAKELAKLQAMYTEKIEITSSEETAKELRKMLKLDTEED